MYLNVWVHPKLTHKENSLSACLTKKILLLLYHRDKDFHFRYRVKYLSLHCEIKGSGSNHRSSSFQAKHVACQTKAVDLQIKGRFC